MQVEAINITGTTLQQMPRASDKIESGRKELVNSAPQPDLEKAESSESTTVQPEEILSQIKSLTENGLYSVRFETSDEYDDALIVKVVDRDTQEIIRQVPAEEILGIKASLAELRGKIVNTTR